MFTYTVQELITLLVTHGFLPAGTTGNQVLFWTDVYNQLPSLRSEHEARVWQIENP